MRGSQLIRAYSFSLSEKPHQSREFHRILDPISVSYLLWEDWVDLDDHGLGPLRDYSLRHARGCVEPQVLEAKYLLLQGYTKVG